MLFIMPPSRPPDPYVADLLLEVQSVTNDAGDGVVTGSIAQWQQFTAYIQFVLHCYITCFIATHVVRFTIVSSSASGCTIV